MNRILYTAASLFAVGLMAFSVKSQTIVSTSPENKNFVLEEYTGVNCQFCPDGHKRAQEIKDSNPNDVVLMNIHVGSFAPNNPPYKTPWGAAIDNQAAVSGYPAGSVNRRTDLNVDYQSGGSAMSRGEWQSAATEIFSETSPVNIAIDASLDTATREMTVLVEVYYTSSTNGPDKLNIALLQNNVKGPQIDGGNFYPEMRYPDGDYNHMHMLRELLTGQWGVDLNNTTQNTFWDSTITYTIPNSYYGLPVSLLDMEVAAFVSDGQENIYTGTQEFLIPSNLSWDMELTSSSSTNDFCSSTTDAQINISNTGNSTITSFDMSYSVNGNTNNTSYSGSIAPGSSDVININGISLNQGANTIAFSAPTNVNNGSLYNPSASGFLAKPENIEVISATSDNSLPYNEDFENAQNGSTAPSLYDYSRDGRPMYVVDNQVGGSSVTWNLGAYEDSPKSYRFRMYSFPPGDEASIISDNYDFSSTANTKLKFDYAYRQLSANENSQLIIEVSTDCGANWASVWSSSGSNLATVGPDNQNVFYPRENEWDSTVVDLSAYDGEPNVMFRVKIVADAGNCIYVDNLNINGAPVGNKEISSFEATSIFPNPTNGNTNLNITSDKRENINIAIYDISGKEVLNIGNKNLNIGLNQVVLRTESLDGGIYQVVVNSNNSTTTVKRLIVK
jgi:hypothetical protein